MAKSQSLRMAPRITLRQTVGIAILIFVAPVAGQSLDLDKQVCVDSQCMSLTQTPSVFVDRVTSNSASGPGRRDERIVVQLGTRFLPSSNFTNQPLQ